tara:strand:- start:376 stop:966 length:591 start_codon:yes stop_codon:yes gene_type:complete
MIIRDEWLSTYDTLRAHATTVEFSGVTNPYDGITYPDITVDIPEECLKEIQEKADDLLGTAVIKQIFMRLTSRNTQTPPHQAHPDNMMGTHTLILYLTDTGGTSLVEHIATGMYAAPETQENWDAWNDDTNIPHKWRIYNMAMARENRVAIFDSRLMHRAEPVGGFGETAEDGRIVLTAFIDSERGFNYDDQDQTS